MTNTQLNNILQFIEDATDQMVVLQQQGNWDSINLLDQECRELTQVLDNEETLITLPLLT